MEEVPPAQAATAPPAVSSPNRTSADRIVAGGAERAAGSVGLVVGGCPGSPDRRCFSCWRCLEQRAFPLRFRLGGFSSAGRLLVGGEEKKRVQRSTLAMKIEGRVRVKLCTGVTKDGHFLDLALDVGVLLLRSRRRRVRRFLRTPENTANARRRRRREIPRKRERREKRSWTCCFAGDSLLFGRPSASTCVSWQMSLWKYFLEDRYVCVGSRVCSCGAGGGGWVTDGWYAMKRVGVDSFSVVLVPACYMVGVCFSLPCFSGEFRELDVIISTI